MTDASLNNAIIQGLRLPIRISVLQQGIKGLKDTTHATKIAESSLVTDPAWALMMESLKNQTPQLETMLSKVTVIAQAQAAEAAVRPPEVKVATEQPTEQPVASGGQRGGGRGNWRGGGRQRRNTPQNQQRANYAQQQQQQYAPVQAQYTEQQPQYQQQQGYAPQNQQPAWTGGEQSNYPPPAGHSAQQTGYERPNQQQQYRPAAGHGTGGPGPQQNQQPGGRNCPNCGYDEHGPRQFCPAVGKTCHNCERVGHFTRVCRQARNQSA